MLAPFTAGWQAADLNPLVIAKSKVFLHVLLFSSSFFSKNWQSHEDLPSPRDNICRGDLSWLQGSYVYDVNGKKYLDSLAGLWCTSLGILTAPDLI